MSEKKIKVTEEIEVSPPTGRQVQIYLKSQGWGEVADRVMKNEARPGSSIRVPMFSEDELKNTVRILRAIKSLAVAERRTDYSLMEEIGGVRVPDFEKELTEFIRDAHDKMDQAIEEFCSSRGKEVEVLWRSRLFAFFDRSEVKTLSADSSEC